MSEKVTPPAYGFVEALAFTRRVYDYFTEEEYGDFQRWLAAQPEAGDVIRATGGIRKVRWDDPTRGKGKRGGTRIIYFLLTDDRQIFLITIYGKDEMSDLTPNQCKLLKVLVEAEKKARSKQRQRSQK